MLSRITFLLATVLTALLVLQSASRAEEGERVFDLNIEKRKVKRDTNTIRVKQGEKVTLRWSTDETVALHLHGYDIEKTLKPRETVEMSFKAHATGRFAIEAHGFGGKKGKHVILLYLEVLPR